ncbi:hypothetical protein MHU86_18836 [Fragilaria crotonensis]|nr:hypothetical protein MHU86_18836 [Fragilaria crotonensis]
MVPGAREQGGGHFIARLRARRRRGHLAHQETWLTLCPTELQDHPLAASPHFADWRLAASAAKTQLLPTQPAPSAAAAGTATHDSSSESESTSTLFSAGSDETKGRKSSRVSLPPFGTDGFAPDSLRQMAMEPCPYHSCHPRRCGSDLQA